MEPDAGGDFDDLVSGQIDAPLEPVVQPSQQMAQPLAERPAQHSLPPPPPPPKSNTLTQIKKTHGAWDRTKRTCAGILVKSQKCDLRANTSLEDKLKKSLEDGDTFDSELLAFEIAFTDDEVPSKEQDDAALQCLANVVAVCKQANKFALAVKGLIKM